MHTNHPLTSADIHPDEQEYNLSMLHDVGGSEGFYAVYTHLTIGPIIEQNSKHVTFVYNSVVPLEICPNSVSNSYLVCRKEANY